MLDSYRSALSIHVPNHLLMANLANITGGTFAGSESVRIECNDVNSTPISLYRGALLLGSGVLTAGACLIAVTPLAKGDILQACVSERGNRCGLPVVVAAANVQVTGWKSPTQVKIIKPDGTEQTLTVDAFEEQYGYRPIDIYDPEGTGAIIFPEYEPEPVAPICFDLVVEKTYGQTTVTVAEAENIKGALLVKFNTGDFSNATSKLFKAAGSVAVAVKGDDDTDQAERTVAVDILAAPATPAAAIKGYVWRGGSDAGGIVLLSINCEPQAQTRLLGFDSAWYNCNFYDPGWQERLWAGVPRGAYTIQIRLENDNNSANWINYPINKTY